jgi:hypothetical protein
MSFPSIYGFVYHQKRYLRPFLMGDRQIYYSLLKAQSYIIWHILYVENIPFSTWWTLNHFACYGIAIAAVFAPIWGPVELDLSPWDSPKGFYNLGRVSGCAYWGHTSGQRYLTFAWFKVNFNPYPSLFCWSWHCNCSCFCSNLRTCWAGFKSLRYFQRVMQSWPGPRGCI